MANGLNLNTSWGTVSLNDSTVNKVFDKAFGWIEKVPGVDLSLGNTPATVATPPNATQTASVGGFNFTKNQLLAAGGGLAVLLVLVALTNKKSGS